MSLFDQLGGVTPRTDSQFNRGKQANHQQQIGSGPLYTEHGLQQGQSKQSKKQQVPQGWARFIKLAYYQQYFQVSQQQVIQRGTHSIITPYRPLFIQITKNNPDFYGPFWIYTTLILLLGFVGNFANYLLSKFSSGQIWDKYFFKLQFIRQAITLIYTFGIGAPIALYFILKLKQQKLDIELPNIICIYGYSLLCFAPAITICILPISFLHWIAILYAIANSTLFLKTNLETYSNGLSPIILASIIGGLQLILALCIKIIFLGLLSSNQ